MKHETIVKPKHYLDMTIEERWDAVDTALRNLSLLHPNHRFDMRTDYREEGECGTAGCIAGTTVLVMERHGFYKSQSRRYRYAYAILDAAGWLRPEQHLELYDAPTDNIARLFFPSMSPLNSRDFDDWERNRGNAGWDATALEAAEAVARFRRGEDPWPANWRIK